MGIPCGASQSGFRECNGSLTSIEVARFEAYFLWLTNFLLEQVQNSLSGRRPIERIVFAPWIGRRNPPRLLAIWPHGPDLILGFIRVGYSRTIRRNTYSPY